VERITLPAPGGLVHVTPDGTPTWQPVDALLNPLGVAASAEGGWWIVDSEAATLWRVEADGTATARLTAEAPGLLQSPNHLAIGPDGKIYLSDPCAGSLLRFDPAADTVDARVEFDPAMDGGPNGVAFDPAGRLHIMTGNAILQCQQIGLAPPDAKLARVWRIPTDDEGFGTPMSLTEPVGTFGDGITFDDSGNLYFIADAIEGLSLTESAVLVLPAQGGPPRTVAVAPEGIIYANLAFGVADFGARTLYISLLSIPPFAGDDSRGLHVLDAQVMRGPTWQ
jgi:sugar lactone lactonase YvrE